MQITRAYCVELGKVISIDDARREFVAGNTGVAQFTFLCSYEPCRAQGTRVTGVNYRKPAQEAVKYRAAHYRGLDEHIDVCEWFEPGAVDRPSTDSHLPDATPRHARRKLDDMVNVFDPRGTNERRGNSSENAATDAGEAFGEVRSTQGSSTSGSSGETRTSSLERLVDLYLEAKSTMTWEEFLDREIQVVGVGTFRLVKYFQRLGQSDGANRVLYGGARLLKRYGLGFKFRFYDKIDGRDVHLYISNEEMREYRHWRYLDSLLKHADTVRYFTLYAIGEIHPAPLGESMELIIGGLHHLVVILGPTRNDAGDSESNTRNAR